MKSAFESEYTVRSQNTQIQGWHQKMDILQKSITQMYSIYFKLHYYIWSLV